MFHICTDDWITDARTGKQYMVQDTDDLVYDVNKQACQNLGGFLPEPRDEAENQFLDSLGSHSFMLGLNDKVTEGQWVWDSDGSPVTWKNFIRWSDGDQEPNGGQPEYCVFMLRQYVSSRGGHRTDGWVDYDCKSYASIRAAPTSLVCQRNPGEFADCALGMVSFFKTHFIYNIIKFLK